MKIYADTSFLISLLYTKETAHARARAFFVAQDGADWLTSEWSYFETVNTLRQFCLSKTGLDLTYIEGVRRLFKNWHARGSFTRMDKKRKTP